MKYAIGIDIGGTTIACGIVNQNGGLIQYEIAKSDPTDRENMFAQVIKCVEKLINHSSIPFEQIYGIGVGVPGKIDRKNGIAIFQNNLPWKNFPLVERMTSVFNKDRIVMDNDVYMAAFAEWNAAELHDELFVYMTISTGISSAIIKSGNFIRGAGFAGEIGLVPVYAPYSQSTLARLEQVASGPALKKYAKERFHEKNMNGEQLFKAYYANDQTAIQLIDEVVTSLVQGVYMVTSLLDPHKIIFGGSVATLNPELLKLIKEKLASYLIDEQKHILDHMEISNLGNEQGIIGAGLNVFRKLL